MNFENCIIIISCFLGIAIIFCLIMSSRTKKKQSSQIESFQNQDTQYEDEKEIIKNAEKMIEQSQYTLLDNEDTDSNILETDKLDDDIDAEELDDDIDAEEIDDNILGYEKTMPIPSSILASSTISPVEAINVVSKESSEKDSVRFKQYSVSDETRKTTSKRRRRCPKNGDNIFWEPKPNLLSPYGYVYMPNTVWEVPQKRDPLCKSKKKNIVCPVYTSGTPDDALEYGQIGNNLKLV